ncbi:glyceraldehyde-3-phosphate dehydrogenase [Striga asiatica]|uniref:glyceraldehyde-3-phosphate dehydrogenase (NADP(+)) (phosphorylating) n=1 Tax=Striga asiatica TaxID=4170 RepID=A0A5A7QXG4_STRAF|nr:glyceraldehyde-3-phosphate dehydrogenase [Striga asiatica]
MRQGRCHMIGFMRKFRKIKLRSTLFDSYAELQNYLVLSSSLQISVWGPPAWCSVLGVSRDRLQRIGHLLSKQATVMAEGQTPQASSSLSKALTGAERKELMRKLPKFIYDEEKALEKQRKKLSEKIEQLNLAIDNMSNQLRTRETTNEPIVIPSDVDAVYYVTAMASHAALASSRIPTSTRFTSKTPHSFPAQSFSKKHEFAEFSGLKSIGCVTFAKNGTDSSYFFDAVAAQLTPKTVVSNPVKKPTVAKLKVAINGFGRIGRNFLRCWHGRKDSPLEVIVVNDSGGVKNYDSMLGTFKAEVKIVDNETISVDGMPIKVVSSRDPLKLPWAELGIDIVIEGTGVFVDGPGAGKHIQAGAKKVIITAPAKGADIPTYVVGVNEKDYSHEVANIISNASCTTNCLAPFVKVMDEEFGIVKGTMTTTHSYTGDQRLLDASHRDLRRARAAALNIVPTSTGAAKAVSLVLPQLKGKLNGIALRVPTPNVSVVDLVVNVEKKGITAEDVNAAFRKAAEGPLAGVLDVCDVPLVSVDFRCSDVSSTIDSSLTMVMGDDMVKVVACQRVVDLAHLMADKWPGGKVKGSGDPLEDFCETSPADKECKVYEA